MATTCTRCGGTSYIKLETANPMKWIYHWCPDCSGQVPGRLDQAGEWVRTPFTMGGQMSSELEAYAEGALHDGTELRHPRSGKVVREPWWREMQATRDACWGWRKGRKPPRAVD